MPASSDASGTISVTETVRASGGHTETINVPNWPSDQHTVSVYFKDYIRTTRRVRGRASGAAPGGAAPDGPSVPRPGKKLRRR